MGNDTSHLKREIRVDKNGVLNTKLVKSDEGGAKNAGKLSSLGAPASAQGASPQVTSDQFTAADWASASTENVDQAMHGDLQSDWWHKDPIALFEKHIEAHEAGHGDVFAQKDPATRKPYSVTVAILVRDQWLSNGGHDLADRTGYSKDPEYKRYRETFEKYEAITKSGINGSTLDAADWAAGTKEYVAGVLQGDMQSDWWHKDPAALLEKYTDAIRAGKAKVFTETNPDTGKAYLEGLTTTVRDQWLKNGGHDLADRETYSKDPGYQRYQDAYANFNTAVKSYIG